MLFLFVTVMMIILHVWQVVQHLACLDSQDMDKPVTSSSSSHDRAQRLYHKVILIILYSASFSITLLPLLLNISYMICLNEQTQFESFIAMNYLLSSQNFK